MGGQANPTDIGLGVATGGLWNIGKAVAPTLTKTGGGNPVYADIPAAVRPLWEKANSYIDSAGQTLNPAAYTMTPLQQQIQNSASGVLSGMLPNMQSYISSVLSPNFANPMTNPNMQAALTGAQNAFTQGLGKNIDMLGSTFGLAGQVPQRSGAFQQTASNLSRQALGDYGDTVSNILMNQYNQSIAQQLQALSQSPMVSNVLNSLSPIASLPQELAMQKITLDQLPFNMILSLLSQTPLAYPSYSPQTPSILQQVAGLLGPAGQAMQGVGAIMAA